MKMKMRKNVYRNIFAENISDFIDLDIFIWISKTITKNLKIHENIAKKSLQDTRQQKNKEMKRKIGLFEYVI